MLELFHKQEIIVVDVTGKALLNNGTQIPYMGFGTYKLLPDSIAASMVMTAIEAGYRHIDTASVYGNEAGVGEAVRNCGIPADELFITTKVWNDEQGYDSTLKAFERSLKKLKTDYVNLYLIHWPVTGLRNDTWKALIEISKSGACKAIGVSNYTIKHLRELFDNSDIKPAVNQVEFNPFNYQRGLLEFCKNNNIQLVAYAPLARNKKHNHPLLTELAEKYSKSPVQIMLKWSLQHEVVIIPRSSHKERIFENADIFDFEIAAEDMNRMDALNENFRTSADPEGYK
jgi:diketogulonate reductase-like aldo/keto reductase